MASTFGFKNPFCALWGHVDYDDVLWVTGCRYIRQVTIPIHAEAIPKGVVYFCDPAQPESIAQLRNHGHECRACVHRPSKGASGEKRNPKMAGIDMVSERIRTNRLRIIRQNCLPLIRELGMYHYDPEKQSEEPVDADNHACDALRYMIVGIDRHKGKVEPEETDADRAAQRLADEQGRQDAARRAVEDPWDPAIFG